MLETRTIYGPKYTSFAQITLKIRQKSSNASNSSEKLTNLRDMTQKSSRTLGDASVGAVIARLHSDSCFESFTQDSFPQKHKITQNPAKIHSNSSEAGIGAGLSFRAKGRKLVSLWTRWSFFVNDLSSPENIKISSSSILTSFS